MDLFPAGGMFGGGGGSKEFGSSTATSTIAGDTIGLQFDQQTLIVVAIAAAVIVAGLLAFLLIRR